VTDLGGGMADVAEDDSCDAPGTPRAHRIPLAVTAPPR